MKIKQEKGAVGTDIAISIVVLFIFVSLISVLIYNFNVSSKDSTRKTRATEIAISEIEDMKTKDFNTLEDNETTDETVEAGYTKTIDVEDYAEVDTNKNTNIIKKVTVTVKYKSRGKTETIELSTICKKEKSNEI